MYMFIMGFYLWLKNENIFTCNYVLLLFLLCSLQLLREKKIDIFLQRHRFKVARDCNGEKFAKT